MTQNRQWKQVSGGSNNQRWEPHKQQFDSNNPPFLSGYFKNFREQSGGQNGPFMVATIQLVNPDKSLGEEVDVAASAVLEDCLSKITLGAYIGIKFCGKVAPKKGGNAYNMWEVFEDEAAVPFHQLGGVSSQRTVHGNNQNNNGQGNNQGQNYNQNNQGTFNNGGTPVFNTNANQNNSGNINSAPVFNNQNNNSQGNNSNVEKKPFVPGTNQNAGNNQNQNFNPNNQGNQNSGGGNNQATGNNNAPIFTGNQDDDNELPF